jgi:3-hydroxyacyl-CoA dehydrogenase
MTTSTTSSAIDMIIPSSVSIIAISDGVPSGTSNPVNALSRDVVHYLHSSIGKALLDPDKTSIVLVGKLDGSGNFSAGADIREFSSSLSTGIGSSSSSSSSPPTAVPETRPTLRDLCDLIEMSPKPVIAGLHGACLGGGMELALSCHYRVSDAKTLRYGLPEVRIGLLPGAGGTQRLTRLVGIRESLDMILRGGIHRGYEAGVKSGFLDGIVDANDDDGSVLTCAVRWAMRASSSPTCPDDLDARRLRNRVVPPDDDGIGNEIMCDVAMSSLPPKSRGGESAHACLEALRASFRDGLSFDDGMEIERGLFEDLLYNSLQGRAYRHVFFAERRRSSSSSSSSPLSSSSSSGGEKKGGGGGATVEDNNCSLGMGRGAVGVIGAGTMGRGIAVSFLRAGYGPVILVDVNPEGLEAGTKDVRSILMRESSKGGGGKESEPTKLAGRLSNLESSTDLSSLSGCDLIVEAAYENLDVKREIFSKLDVIVSRRDALILSNTSTLDVDAIASSLSLDRRPYCAGMHFFSPAHIMKLVEVVRGEATSESTLDVISATTRRIGKVPVVVGNCDGFVGNRMIHPYTTEACLLLAEYGGGDGRSGLGICDVDDAMGQENFGMAVGPFVMSDIAGNDIG